MSKAIEARGNWRSPKKLRFRVRQISRFGVACVAQGIKHPLLVTESGISGRPLIAEALEICRGEGLAVALFDGIDSNQIDEIRTLTTQAPSAGGKPSSLDIPDYSALIHGPLSSEG